jgi:hypothetical protein
MFYKESFVVFELTVYYLHISIKFTLITREQKSIMRKEMYVYCDTKENGMRGSAIPLEVVKVLHMNYSSLQMALVSLSPFSLCFFFST